MLVYKNVTSYLHDITTNGYTLLIIFHISFAAVGLVLPLLMIAADIFILLNDIEQT